MSPQSPPVSDTPLTRMEPSPTSRDDHYLLIRPPTDLGIAVHQCLKQKVHNINDFLIGKTLNIDFCKVDDLRERFNHPNHLKWIIGYIERLKEQMSDPRIYYGNSQGHRKWAKSKLIAPKLNNRQTIEWIVKYYSKGFVCTAAGREPVFGIITVCILMYQKIPSFYSLISCYGPGPRAPKFSRFITDKNTEEEISRVYGLDKDEEEEEVPYAGTEAIESGEEEELSENKSNNIHSDISLLQQFPQLDFDFQEEDVSTFQFSPPPSPPHHLPQQQQQLPPSPPTTHQPILPSVSQNDIQLKVMNEIQQQIKQTDELMEKLRKEKHEQAKVEVWKKHLDAYKATLTMLSAKKQKQKEDLEVTTQDIKVYTDVVLDLHTKISQAGK